MMKLMSINFRIEKQTIFSTSIGTIIKCLCVSHSFFAFTVTLAEGNKLILIGFRISEFAGT